MQKTISEMANPFVGAVQQVCVLIARNEILLTDFIILEGNIILKLNKFGQQNIFNSDDKEVSYFSPSVMALRIYHYLKEFLTLRKMTHYS